MLLVRSIDLDMPAPLTGDIVDGVLGAVEASVPVWAYLEDSGHSKISGIARARKKFPAIDRLTASHPPDGGPVLASLPHHRAPEPAFAIELDRDTAIGVARGVPKSFPLHHYVVVAGPLPELWLADGAPRSPRCIGSHLDHGEVGAAIVIRSSWSSSRRSVRVTAHLWSTPPGREARKLPELPPPTRALLDALGRPAREEQHLVAEDSEAAVRDSAEPAAVALVEAIDRSALPLPQPDLAGDEWHAGGDQTFGSFLTQLGRRLPRWRYHPTSRGRWTFTRRTAANNELVVQVDRGPIGGNARASLAIRGPLWSHHVTLPATRTATELSVWSEATLASLCDNWVAAIEVLERDLVPELEGLYWPGFAWYSRGVR